MKKCFFLLPFLLLNACHNKECCREFVNVSDVVNYGYKVAKPSLLCLIDNKDKMSSIEICDSLLDGFVHYFVRNPMNTVLGKILQPSKYPVYIIFQKDSVVSLFYHEELEKQLGSTNKSQLQYNLLNNRCNNKDIEYLNILLRLERYLKNQTDKFTIELSTLDSLVGKQNKFYGKYLLAQFYKNINSERACEMYNSLWIKSTTDEMKVYPEEFIDIMKSKDHLISVNEEDIKFDYTEYDFGTIEPYEEVECVFYFTNNSCKRFVIHNVITTCGCTVPLWNRQPISPNVRDSISVKFKTDHTGVNKKTIIVEGNCKQKIKLRIKALVS